MKDFFKKSNQDSAEFGEYKDFIGSLLASKRSGIQEDNFFAFLETIKNLDNVYKFRAFYDLIDLIVNLGILDQYYSQIETQFLTFLKVIGNLPEKSTSLYYMYKVAVMTSLINEHFPFFLESIEKLTSVIEYMDISLSNIFKAAYETGLLEEYFTKFFRAVDRLSDFWKFHAYSQLLNAAVESGLIKKYYSAFLERIDTLPDEFKHRVTYHLIDLTRSTEFFHKFSAQIETLIVNLIDTFERVPIILNSSAFSALLEAMKIMGMINEHFSELLEIADQFLGDMKYHALENLIDSIKDTELFINYYTIIKDQFFYFLEDTEKFVFLNKYKAFHALLKLEEGTGLIADYTPIYLEMIKKMSCYDCECHNSYSELLEVLKKSGLKQEYFPIFLEILTTFPIPSRYNAFCSLLEAANANDLVKGNFFSFLEVIKGFNNIEKYNAFHELNKTIKNTDLMINYKTEILSIFQSLLKDFKSLRDCEQYDGFITMLEIVKKTELMKNFLNEILGIFPELPDINSLDPCSREVIYSSFVEAIESFDLENELVFKIWNDKNQHFDDSDCY